MLTSCSILGSLFLLARTRGQPLVSPGGLTHSTVPQFLLCFPSFEQSLTMIWPPKWMSRMQRQEQACLPGDLGVLLEARTPTASQPVRSWGAHRHNRRRRCRCRRRRRRRRLWSRRRWCCRRLLSAVSPVPLPPALAAAPVAGCSGCWCHSARRGLGSTVTCYQALAQH